MALERFDGLEIRAAADMHVHLRDGAMMELVTYEMQSTLLTTLAHDNYSPTIRRGGVNTVFVMVR